MYMPAINGWILDYWSYSPLINLVLINLVYLVHGGNSQQLLTRIQHIYYQEFMCIILSIIWSDDFSWSYDPLINLLFINRISLVFV